jgi:hypothetical protein
VEVSRRDFLKMLGVAAGAAIVTPAVSKISLAESLIQTVTQEPIATSPVHTYSWNLVIINKNSKPKEILFNDFIDGDPEIQAAKIAKRLSASNAGVLTVWLTPMRGENAIRGQKSYYEFNGMKFT